MVHFVGCNAPKQTKTKARNNKKASLKKCFFYRRDKKQIQKPNLISASWAKRRSQRRDEKCLKRADPKSI